MYLIGSQVEFKPPIKANTGVLELILIAGRILPEPQARKYFGDKGFQAGRKEEKVDRYIFRVDGPVESYVILPKDKLDRFCFQI